MNRNQNQNKGFTLIELLVVITIIALLSSVVMIALMSAREKARDAKRLGDMTQMNNAFELYFASFKGYPSETNGIPQGLGSSPASLPVAPSPADGVCAGAIHEAACVGGDSACNNVPANTYYYVPSGTAYLGSDGVSVVYPDYAYYFCLGNQTGDYHAGEHVLTPEGVK